MEDDEAWCGGGANAEVSVEQRVVWRVRVKAEVSGVPTPTHPTPTSKPLERALTSCHPQLTELEFLVELALLAR